MWICNNCKEDNEDQFVVCWNCGAGKDGLNTLTEEEKIELQKQKNEVEEFKKEKDLKDALRKSGAGDKSSGIKFMVIGIGLVIIILSIPVYRIEVENPEKVRMIWILIGVVLFIIGGLRYADGVSKNSKK